ncbi:MAG: membrane protein insertion efficiency factor YidD, partial [Waddliaceae bacterium]
EASIYFHQNVISPADGPRSHYFPSSSQYTLEAIRKYGFFKGVIYGCDRLMRENDDPWIYPEYMLPDCTTLKYDPVP